MATMTTMRIHEIDEHDGDLAEEIDLDADAEDLKVYFNPQLHMQRRMWILEILRRESIVDVLDVGCGEGELLGVLAQPAPWLAPPTPSLFPGERANGADFCYKSDMPNLHARRIAGLDISAPDLAFAVRAAAPTNPDDDAAYTYSLRVTRWEGLTAKVWQGGLQVINEEFVGVECIVCTEVIEHLPPDVLPALAPTLLGVYHPTRLLLTTPSYTFNARFARPGARRKGYPDPTGRTNRVFRHHDHKFEWTVEEFTDWARGAADTWGYELEELSGVGRAWDADPWGRDEELGDASLVVAFRRKDDGNDADRAARGRAALTALGLGGAPHELLAEHVHTAHETARTRPTADSVKLIGDAVKAKMESFREAFIALEQMWFEQDISTLCGGWIEVLIWAVEEYEGLTLLKGRDGSKEWSIELVGGVKDPLMIWPQGAERSVDLIPKDWIPGQDPEDLSDEDVSSTGADGDVSWNGSEIEDAQDLTWTRQDGDETWGKTGGWGEGTQERWAGCTPEE